MIFDCCAMLEEAFKMDRERIIMALQGKLVRDETEEDFVYDNAPKEDCEEFILSTFDHDCDLAIKCSIMAKRLEEILRDKGMDDDAISREYIKKKNEMYRRLSKRHKWRM